jgi:hypothetical protein
MIPGFVKYKFDCPENRIGFGSYSRKNFRQDEQDLQDKNYTNPVYRHFIPFTSRSVLSYFEKHSLEKHGECLPHLCTAYKAE